MSLMVKVVKRLSELEIDADKNWQAKGISNLKELALGMSAGDLVVRGTDVLQKFPPGIIGYVLTSAGAGHLPAWMPVPGVLEFWFPVWIELSHAEARLVVDKSHSDNISVVTSHVQAYLDAPGDNIRRLDRAMAVTDAEAIVTVDQSISKNVSAKSGLSILCDGFVEETAAAVQTDKTAEARDAAANDLNLNPMTPATDDKVYVGSTYKFWQIIIEVGTGGVGNWTNHWYYWNGAAWVPVVDELDGSNEWLHGAGVKLIRHTPQADWAQSNILGMNLYWLRSNTDVFVNQATAPLGSQVWVAIA